MGVWVFCRGVSGEGCSVFCGFIFMAVLSDSGVGIVGWFVFLRLVMGFYIWCIVFLL